MKNSMTRNIVFVALLAVILFGLQFLPAPKVTQKTPTPTTAAVPSVTKAETVSYNGREGITALALLQEKATVEQDDSGMVSSIGGRAADAAKHEYWAFYVNDTLASVGAHEYVTKDTDKIAWKIETY